MLSTLWFIVTNLKNLSFRSINNATEVAPVLKIIRCSYRMLPVTGSAFDPAVRMAFNPMQDGQKYCYGKTLAPNGVNQYILSI